MLKYTVAMLVCALLAQHAQAQSPNGSLTVTQSFDPWGYNYDVAWSMPPGWVVSDFKVLIDKQGMGGSWTPVGFVSSYLNPTNPTTLFDSGRAPGYYRAQVRFYIMTPFGWNNFYTNYVYWYWL